MIRSLSIDVRGAFIAKKGGEEEEVGGEGALEAENEKNEDEYVQNEGNDEDAAFEDARVRVEVEDVEVGFGSQGAKERCKCWRRWLERGRNG